LVGACVLADRSGGKVDVGCRLEALVTLDIPSWSAEECPLCAKGLALESPGSKFLAVAK
jgi:orotate phosphoribosyltransferase